MVKKLKTEIVIFLLIMAVASFFRFYKLTSLPPGLYPDEAMNGNNAIQALTTGNFKIFYPENNGREGLFINIEALSVGIFGIHPWSLRLVSAIIGVLTVAGLYFLTKELFGWEIAALAAFLMSVSSWHVIFSRIGFRAIMLPLVLVWGFYFLYRGLHKIRQSDFLIAGIIGGLGFYTYFSYRIAPLIALVMVLTYWFSANKKFPDPQFKQAKTKIIQGLGMFLFASVMLAVAIGMYFMLHPGDFLKRDGAPISVFAQAEPFKQLALSTAKTLGMFIFAGDYNWRHNISGWPELSLPLAILFAIGFLRELGHWLRKKGGHFSVIHTFLFTWFFIMLLPGFLSTEAPHALRNIGVIPVVMIFSALGLYWLFEKLYRWHVSIDPHVNIRESKVLVLTVLAIFLSSLGFLEYFRYFIVYASAPETITTFNQNYVDLAGYLNRLSPSDQQRKKYILVNNGDVLVNGIPVSSQTVMFLTDTYTPEKQAAKNIFYLTQDDYAAGRYDKDSIIIPLGK